MKCLLWLIYVRLPPHLQFRAEHVTSLNVSLETSGPSPHCELGLHNGQVEVTWYICTDSPESACHQQTDMWGERPVQTQYTTHNNRPTFTCTGLNVALPSCCYREETDLSNIWLSAFPALWWRFNLDCEEEEEDGGTWAFLYFQVCSLQTELGWFITGQS